MQTYPEAPYYEGKFTNGPVWIEVVAKQFGVALANYAAGGATSGIVIASNFSPFFLPCECLSLQWSLSMATAVATLSTLSPGLACSRDRQKPSML